MASDFPSFNSPALTGAVEETAAQVQGFTQNLDKMSADIKKLEEYYLTSGIRVVVEAPISTGESVLWTNEWGLTPEEHDRWRIVYLRQACTWHPEYETYVADGEIEEYRPLIEIPVAVRLRAYRALPDLVREIGQQVTVHPLEAIPDLPF